MGVDNTISKLKAYFEKWHNSQGTHSNLIYPVGSIYMTIDEEFNPANAFGGEWQQIQGCFLLGAGIAPQDNNVEYKTGKTGGSKNAIVVEHAHEIPHNHTQSKHTHNIGNHKHGTSGPYTHFLLSPEGSNVTVSDAAKLVSDSSGKFVLRMSNQSTILDIGDVKYTGLALDTNGNSAPITSESQPTISIYNGSSNNYGSPSADANMPPFLVVKMWKRIR